MRYLFRAILGFAALVAVSGAATADTGRGLALVIGNGKYTTGAISNTVNDAGRIAETLRREHGFEVAEHTNLSAGDLRKALAKLRDDVVGLAQSGAPVIVYYGGFANTANGENFLLPVDAGAGTSNSRVRVPLSEVMSAVKGYSGEVLILLDASYNHDLVDTADGTAPGLAGMASVEDGIAVVFANQPGRAVPVTDKSNGYLANALTRWLGAKRDMSVGRWFDTLRDAVVEDSLSDMDPWLIATPKTRTRTVRLAALSIDQPRNANLIGVPPSSPDAPAPPVPPVTSEAKTPSQIAALPQPKEEPPAARLSPFEAMDEKQRAMQMQVFLRDRQCYSAGIDGDWGRGSAGALEEYVAQLPDGTLPGSLNDIDADAIPSPQLLAAFWTDDKFRGFSCPSKPAIVERDTGSSKNAKAIDRFKDRKSRSKKTARRPPETKPRPRNKAKPKSTPRSTASRKKNRPPKRATTASRSSNKPPIGVGGVSVGAGGISF